MAQCGELLTGVHNRNFQFIDDDTWMFNNLSSVSWSWRVTDLGMPRRQLGTIVLTPRRGRYRYYEQRWGTTVATLLKLAHHSMEYNISPNQYSCLDTVANIRQYEPIWSATDRAYLEGRFHTLGYHGQPVWYENVTAIDLSDTTDIAVTKNRDSLEMCLVDIFDPCGVPKVHFTFVAYLLRQFFPKRHFHQSVSYHLVHSCLLSNQLDNAWKADLEQMFVYGFVPSTFGYIWVHLQIC